MTFVTQIKLNKVGGFKSPQNQNITKESKYFKKYFEILFKYFDIELILPSCNKKHTWKI